MHTPSPFDLAGKVALVTGAGRGLGLEIARGLARAGATVVCNGRSEAPLAEVVAALTAEGLAADAAPFDVTDEAATQAIAAINAQHGRLDILVNNVGARDRRDLFDFAVEDVRRLLEIDLVAPFHLSREAAKAMIAAGGGGRIINITSIAGPIARSGDAAYTAAKGGLDALTRALAAELGPHGITVNALAPGYFATEANAEMVADEATADWLRRRTALGRWGRPEEFAGAAVFLASDAAAFITGQTLAVDGGYLSHF